MFHPKCVKCAQQYDSDEPDDFYCPTCDTERKEIAKQIDAKLRHRPPKRQVLSLLQEYDAAPKVRGFVITKL